MLRMLKNLSDPWQIVDNIGVYLKIDIVLLIDLTN